MKRKTIIITIKKKLDAWLFSIEDQKLAVDVKNSLIVSGGCIASMMTGQDVNDYDVYIQSKDVLKRLMEYYIDKYGCDMVLIDGAHMYDSFRNFGEGSGHEIACRNMTPDRLKLYSSEGIQRVDPLIIKQQMNNADNKETVFVPACFTANAISLTNDVQIVTRFHGDATEIHKNYDFIHATNYFTYKDGLVTNIAALESLMSKTLVYSGSLYPLTSIIRAKKFILRGYNINAGEYLKMIYQVSLLDLNNYDVLEEQLMGVDVAYFGMLIDILRQTTKDDPEFKMSSDWLFKIIDKLFNEDHEDRDDYNAD